MKSDGVTAVIGAVLTNTTLAVADKTYEDNMPQITASATAASVTVLDPTDENSDIRTNVFRACFIDRSRARRWPNMPRSWAPPSAPCCMTAQRLCQGRGRCVRCQVQRAGY